MGADMPAPRRHVVDLGEETVAPREIFLGSVFEGPRRFFAWSADGHEGAPLSQVAGTAGTPYKKLIGASLALSKFFTLAGAEFKKPAEASCKSLISKELHFLAQELLYSGCRDLRPHFFTLILEKDHIMKALKRIAVAAAAGMLLIAGAGAAQAAALNTTSAAINDGILQNFSGIDWNANGAGWIQGFGLTSANLAGDSDTFTFTYQAFAGSIGTTSPTPHLYIASPGPGPANPAQYGYELTTYATLNETATCNNNGCSSITITTNSGNFQIFFDTTPDANAAAGTGFMDGVQIIAGTFSGGFTNFGATGPIGPGSIGSGGGFLAGIVTSTNSAYINPNLLGTTLQASLQFPGQDSPTYNRPTAFNGVATTVDTAQNFVLQTDTSQNFARTSVPEPATILLFGVGFMGMGLYRRRKQH